MQFSSPSPSRWEERLSRSPCNSTKKERRPRRVCCSLPRSSTSRSCSWRWSRPNYEQHFRVDGTHGRAAKREGLENHIDLHPNHHGGSFALAPANGSERAPAAHDFFLWQGANLPAGESK